MPFPKNASYQKLMLQIFILIAGIPLGLSWFGDVMEIKRCSYVLWEPNKKWATTNLFYCSSFTSSNCYHQIWSPAQRTESRVLGKCLADFHAKAAAAESVKIVAHVDEIYNISEKKKKNNLLLLNFCHPDIFNTAKVHSWIREIKMGKHWL